jgi:hypothetical protein
MPQDTIVEIIGEDNFQWLTERFNWETTLEDLPREILERVASVDITIRNFLRDRNAVTAIALITFAYKMAGKAQRAQFGAKDITLLKVLAGNEKARRGGAEYSRHPMWGAPLFELITGEVGERIRSMGMLNSPL